LAIYFQRTGATVLFALISFLALREMLTITPTRRGDHHTMFWAFFVLIPIQYYLVYAQWYGLFAIFIPVYGQIFLAIRSTLTGDYTRYLERTAKIQWSAFICIYCISHAPALLTLHVPGYDGHPWELLVWLVIVVQMSDVLQYCWGKLLGRRKDRAAHQPEQDVGRLYRRRADGDAPGRRAPSHHAVQAVAGGGDRVRRRGARLLRRDRHVRGQARRRRKGLWTTHRRPRRDDGPDRLAHLRRADLLPHRPFLVRHPGV
jgi:hypothetical protein